MIISDFPLHDFGIGLSVGRPEGRHLPVIQPIVRRAKRCTIYVARTVAAIFLDCATNYPQPTLLQRPQKPEMFSLEELYSVKGKVGVASPGPVLLMVAQRLMPRSWW